MYLTMPFYVIIINFTKILDILSSVLVDKDNSPRWNPRKLEGVSDEKVDSYFLPLGERDLVL